MTITTRGSVRNGIMTITAVTNGQVVGYRRPLRTKAPASTSPSVVTLPQPPRLDVPDFMKQRTAERQATHRYTTLKEVK